VCVLEAMILLPRPSSLRETNLRHG
jgi:hypothetical protein